MPVWVAAAAQCAGQVLSGKDFDSNQTIDFPNGEESIVVPIRSASVLDDCRKAIGISNCDSGKCLDITSDLEIWTYLEYVEIDINSNIFLSSDESWLEILPGYGVGKSYLTNEISISQFARELLLFNLHPFRKKGYLLKLEIIFPSGRKLAEKTSNSSFGIVDGLALIGTQAEVQASASPQQLQNTIEVLRKRCSKKDFSGFITFVIGENGLNLALELGISSAYILKIGNWIGPLLVAASQEGVKELLLFGYHGKLIKLAGGVFHTHHHLADNRFETLISLAFRESISFDLIKIIEQANSIEEAFLLLESKDKKIAKQLWKRVSEEVERKSVAYVQRYLASSMQIGTVMFDRKRKLRWAGLCGLKKIDALGLTLQD